MRLEKKRKCAIAAVQKIRDVVMLDMEVEKDLKAERLREKRRKAAFKKGIAFRHRRGRAAKTIKATMMCVDCKLPMFHHRTSTGQSSAKICKCRQRLHYGSFWEEPPGKDKGQRQTSAVYRCDDQCQWGTASNSAKEGGSSAPQMVVKLPGGKIVFDPSKEEAICIPKAR